MADPHQPEYVRLQKDDLVQHEQGSSAYEPIGVNGKAFITLLLKWLVFVFNVISSAADMKRCNLCDKYYQNASFTRDHCVGGHMKLVINGETIELIIRIIIILIIILYSLMIY